MRFSSNTILYLFCIVLLSSCEFKCSVGNTTDKPSSGKTVVSTTVEKNGTTLTNGIELEAKGVKVKKATLLLPDNSRVSDDNIVALNQKIRLVLFMGEGWVTRDGKASIGASEKITASTGEVVINAEDLFSDYTETGMDPEDARLITLSAVITKESSDASYYTVQFSAWDKYGDATVKGSYKFSIKH